MKFERATFLYYRMANWFACHDPGTLVPEWCELSWPIRQSEVDRLIKLYEEDTGKKIEGEDEK